MIAFNLLGLHEYVALGLLQHRDRMAKDIEVVLSYLNETTIPIPKKGRLGRKRQRGGGIYVTLGRLVDAGLVRSELGLTERYNRTARSNYYSITPSGRLAFKNATINFNLVLRIAKEGGL